MQYFQMLKEAVAFSLLVFGVSAVVVIISALMGVL